MHVPCSFVNKTGLQRREALIAPFTPVWAGHMAVGASQTGVYTRNELSFYDHCNVIFTTDRSVVFFGRLVVSSFRSQDRSATGI